MTDLMERLSRANPRESGEATTPEERQEADTLLERLVAEPLPKPTPWPRLRPRRLALGGAVAAVLAGAVLVAVDLLDRGGDPDGGIVARAAAAVSREDAIYAVSERLTITSLPLAQTAPHDRVRGDRVYRRWWVWSGGHRSRFLDYAVRPDGSRGALQTEFAFDGDRMTTWAADTNTVVTLDRRGAGNGPSSFEGNAYPGFDPYGDPGAQLRDHVQHGRLRVAGRTRVRGRDAYRLVSGTFDPKGEVRAERVTYAVDARSYLPIEVRVSVRMPRQRVVLRVEYLRYDRLPVTEANRRLLEIGAHPGAQRAGG
jgi:hypothetical protein